MCPPYQSSVGWAPGKKPFIVPEANVFPVAKRCDKTAVPTGFGKRTMALRTGGHTRGRSKGGDEQGAVHVIKDRAFHKVPTLQCKIVGWAPNEMPFNAPEATAFAVAERCDKAVVPTGFGKRKFVVTSGGHIRGRANGGDVKGVMPGLKGRVFQNVPTLQCKIDGSVKLNGTLERPGDCVPRWSVGTICFKSCFFSAGF